MHYADLNYGHCGMAVLTRCANSSVMSGARYGSYHGSHRDLIPLIAECVPLDVALAFMFRYVLQNSSLVRQHGC